LFYDWFVLFCIGNKSVDIKFSAHERFWNNLHQVGQNHKIGKPNNLIVLGAQDLWVLMLSRSFFTPGRDIGSAVFMVQITADTKQKSNISNSVSPYSP
jgi:hypothetical protein